MAFTHHHFTCVMIISIVTIAFPLLLVSADDTSTSCEYPCLPPPAVQIANCPPPPLLPETGYGSYPPPPPYEYYPYYSPPNNYNMHPSPPPPNPMLPWFPWYYNHKGSPSVSKGNSVFFQGSLHRSNVVLTSIFMFLMIL